MRHFEFNKTKYSEYTLTDQVPTVEEYNYVRQAAGLMLKDRKAVENGLANSLYSVCVKHRNKVIGFGRVIGDGGCFFQIVDVAILPRHQRKGIGRKIMESIMGYIHENAPSTATINLINACSERSHLFYKKFGFKIAPPEAPGMYQLVE